ncbi:hypothetical protein BCR41DRAFT_42489 [Lobosporangium transversale]|uniref:Uncharacterized protein n=1 Tax=Lobosporangium transversale TaxID=64571 RepID=A0A1Y2GQT0_9FUNG|nr:hypothetical protein BCR41DRAFT_42489 [Lobosporangium transversale]ORZ19256.1 hypothetical protein BCR41DRAFT_42489 [Lobosporangium transversale]|eukprot:XP_021882424.1 hypothetical protein BCR41DRAFT_42489 [Lobosporangium transversale]
MGLPLSLGLGLPLSLGLGHPKCIRNLSARDKIDLFKACFFPFLHFFLFFLFFYFFTTNLNTFQIYCSAHSSLPNQLSILHFLLIQTTAFPTPLSKTKCNPSLNAKHPRTIPLSMRGKCQRNNEPKRHKDRWQMSIELLIGRRLLHGCDQSTITGDIEIPIEPMNGRGREHSGIAAAMQTGCAEHFCVIR